LLKNAKLEAENVHAEKIGGRTEVWKFAVVSVKSAKTQFNGILKYLPHRI